MMGTTRIYTQAGNRTVKTQRWDPFCMQYQGPRNAESGKSKNRRTVLIDAGAMLLKYKIEVD